MIFQYYNEGCAMNTLQRQKPRYAKHFTDRDRDASVCVACGQCESKCPQNIPIIEKLKEAGGTIQELIILEDYGHGGFPDDYDARMGYVKKSMGME
jgi:predicted aldo/keto reductase-like oxidoreductase